MGQSLFRILATAAQLANGRVFVVCLSLTPRQASSDKTFKSSGITKWVSAQTIDLRRAGGVVVVQEED